MPTRRTLQQAELGLNLAMVSLGVFFASMMVAVLLVSRRLPESIPLPMTLWSATVVLVVSSVALHRAGRAIRRERQKSFRANLLTAWVLGLVFFVLQGVGLYRLYVLHVEQTKDDSQAGILLALLVGLHAVHVTVGLGILAVICRVSFRGRYDHEYDLGFRLSTRYWHFLGLVWAGILATSAYLLR